VKGPEGFENIMFTNIHTGFPDLHLDLGTVIQEDDMVAFRVEGSGTHQGLFLGIEATGKTVRFRGFHQARIKDGLIVELWQGPDMVTILLDMGLFPPKR
jgi:predicted ester cyclase